ncbi:hypothetical protein VT50_0214580 [Streptomyces antioxidans]|uniref:Uncharacterized protein n=1 Tax=Streptomyces antioxidans TaxID=1507734 RepID=A0A1V4D5U9_9ACTN|nr:hypothetical protein VT50_0214580 [Streptomyces antioxidans]
MAALVALCGLLLSLWQLTSRWPPVRPRGGVSVRSGALCRRDQFAGPLVEVSDEPMPAERLHAPL